MKSANHEAPYYVILSFLCYLLSHGSRYEIRHHHIHHIAVQGLGYLLIRYDLSRVQLHSNFYISLEVCLFILWQILTHLVLCFKILSSTRSVFSYFNISLFFNSYPSTFCFLLVVLVLAAVIVLCLLLSFSTFHFHVKSSVNYSIVHDFSSVFLVFDGLKIILLRPATAKNLEVLNSYIFLLHMTLNIKIIKYFNSK